MLAMGTGGLIALGIIVVLAAIVFIVVLNKARRGG